jgi:excisionase family DNA binding protein
MILKTIEDARRERKYLTVAEVADYLQLSVETVYMYARTGIVPATKIGKHWRFSLDRIEDWMSRQDAAEPAGGLRVLMVEPDIQIAEAFKTWFSEAGCEVYSVASREQAYPLLNAKHFDLILLDLMDPRLGGLEALRELHEMKPTAEVVVAASRFDADVMNQALDIGPLTVLRRPVAKADLLKLVEAHKQNSAHGPATPARMTTDRFAVPAARSTVFPSRSSVEIETPVEPAEARGTRVSSEAVYTI